MRVNNYNNATSAFAAVFIERAPVPIMAEYGYVRYLGKSFVLTIFIVLAHFAIKSRLVGKATG